MTTIFHFRMLHIAYYVTVFGFIIYYIWKRMNRYLEITPVHFYQETSEFISHILSNSKHLGKPFKPQVWMSNRHLQTLLPCIMELLAHDVKLEREYLTMDDGEQVAADWVVSDIEGRMLKDIVIILPGITGDPKGYPTLCRMCVEHNYRTVLISKRGYGGSKLTLPKLTGFGDGTDLHCALKIVRARYPEAKIGAIGYSAGTSVLSGYTAEFSEDCLVDVAVGLSPGYQAEKLFTRPKFSKIYEKFMVGQLKKTVVLPNLECLCQASGVQRENLLEASSIIELEEHLYSKVNGFETIADYWKANDPIHVWGRLRVPFMCINSLDDPVCGKELIPFEQFEKYPNTILITTEKGGHCGFYESTSPVSWSHVLSIDFITTVFKYLDLRNGQINE